MLIVFMSEYWQNDKFKTLDRNTKSIVSLTQNNLMLSWDSVYVTDINIMKSFIYTFSQSSNSDVFVTDLNGNILLASDDTNINLLNNGISKKIVDEVLLGSYHAIGDMDQLYTENCFIVAQPVFYETSMGYQEPIATVFSISSMEYLRVFILDSMKMFVIAAVAALLMSFIVITLLNYKTVKPLREMAEAAKCFGQGDFSKRVPVVNSDEIGQLAAAFNNMAESLSSSEETRRSFIANVSHELKTPMTTIAGFIDGILDGTIPKDKQEYYLNIVSQEVKRLSRLVKTMLSLSRIDNGELHINRQCFDITSMLVKCLITFESDINNKHINIEGLENSQSIFVSGDPDMLYQVLYNLIENAVKFVNEGGYISFNIEEKNDSVNVKIRNSGDGISNDDISMIFDKFYKTDKSRSKDKNGMGLGLYIVRKIIRLHGGSIQVDSVQGEFCEFNFWIPGLAKRGKDIIEGETA